MVKPVSGVVGTLAPAAHDDPNGTVVSRATASADSGSVLVIAAEAVRAAGASPVFMTVTERTCQTFGASGKAEIAALCPPSTVRLSEPAFTTLVGEVTRAERKE